MYNSKYKDEKLLNATEELFAFNILKEYSRLIKFKIELKTYDKALFLICECIIDKVQHDRINGDFYSKEHNNKIKNAGELLNEYDGTSVMYDVLMDWVPKRYRREIDMIWDGIGDWSG